MAARAMWKGRLRVGDEEVPFKLFAAASDRKVHFRLLSERTKSPVRQRMVSARTGREVPAEKVRRGVVMDDGRIVVLADEELAQLDPEPSREVELVSFVPRAEVDPAWYERPYWLAPDGEPGAYAALAAALAAEERAGVARWVMRGKRYKGALLAEDGRLLLVTLRSAGEVVPASALPEPAGREPDAREIRMAEQLIDALAGDFDPSEWKDEYRGRVLELVKAKAEGRTLELPEFEKEEVPEKDLTARLEESLAALREAA